MEDGEPMGRNNIQQRSKDTNWGFNKTRQIPFKFEVLSESQCRNFELAQGLQMFKLTKAIKLNGFYELKNNDEIQIKGKKYIVVTLSDSYDNPMQGRYKASFDDFTGSTIVGLE